MKEKSEKRSERAKDNALSKDPLIGSYGFCSRKLLILLVKIEYKEADRP